MKNVSIIYLDKSLQGRDRFDVYVENQNRNRLSLSLQLQARKMHQKWCTAKTHLYSLCKIR